MTDHAVKRDGWKRVWLLIAVLYAIPVALAVWVSYPTERKIESDTASNAVWAVQQHDEKYRSMSRQEIRRRLYRGLSDAQVIARVREQAGKEEQRVVGSADPTASAAAQAALALLADGVPRPRLAVLMEEIEQEHARRVAALKADQLTTIGWGVAAWLIPVVLLYFVIPRFLRPRRRAVQRL